MNKSSLFLIFWIAVLNSIGLQAQEENNWCFGNAGFNFNSGSPVPFSVAPNFFGNPSASVSDKQGNLLFYTEGNFIWNKLNQIMPNGSDIVTDPLFGSAGNFSYYSGFYHGSTIIIPMPDSINKYYVFSLTSQDLGQYRGRLYYSIVNMDLNGGLGDVEPGRKSLFLDSNLTMENWQMSPANVLTGAVGDVCNVWLLAASYSQQQGAFLKAYSITSAGIDPNVATSSLNIHARNGTGQQILVSPDRKKLAYAPNATLFDFDAATGKVSNPVQLQEIIAGGYYTTNVMYDQVVFSPDNTKLYVGALSGNNGGTFQFDISSGDSATMVASKAQIAPEGTVLKLGPDGKIYMSRQGLGSPFLYGTINQPNLPGTACQLIPNTPVFGPASGSNGYMLPNVVPVFRRDTFNYTKSFNPDCKDSVINLVADTLTGFDYVWSDGTTGTSRIVKEAGTYKLIYHTPPCITHINIYQVNPWQYFEVNLGNDTVICGSDFMLHAGVQGSYLWQDGSAADTFTAHTSGTYWVNVTKNNCTISDSINVQLKNTVQNLGPDKTLCKQDEISLVLNANAAPGSSVLWSSGDIGSSLVISDSGTYWVQVTDAPCTGSDTVVIQKVLCDCHVSVPDAFSPNDDGRNDRFRPVIEPGCRIRGYRIMIYNRWGQIVYQSNQESNGWDGTFSGQAADIGTYMYTLEMETVANIKTEKYIRKGDVTLIR